MVQARLMPSFSPSPIPPQVSEGQPPGHVLEQGKGRLFLQGYWTVGNLSLEFNIDEVESLLRRNRGETGLLWQTLAPGVHGNMSYSLFGFRQFTGISPEGSDSHTETTPQIKPFTTPASPLTPTSSQKRILPHWVVSISRISLSSPSVTSLPQRKSQGLKFPRPGGRGPSSLGGSGLAHFSFPLGGEKYPFPWQLMLASSLFTLTSWSLDSLRTLTPVLQSLSPPPAQLSFQRISAFHSVSSL